MTEDRCPTVPTIAVIAGDGIGPEVTAQAVRVLWAVLGQDGLHTVDVDLGADHWRATGEVLDDSTLERLRSTDAILLGAVGAAPGSRDVPSGLLERGLLLKLRFALAHGVNLRPSHWWPGTPTPLSSRVLERGPIDLVVCREGTEGLYCGNGGVVREGTEEEIATEVSVNTARGVERVVRDAFARARARRGHLTLVHKHNVLVHAGGLWRRVVEEVAEDFDEVEWDYLHVDAATIALVEDPQRFDVIVTDNLFGDILTDLTASITGGIGLAPSANIDPTRAHPSMFEPVHGSAPDIAGTGRADPTAAVLSAGLLLDHLGHTEAAERVRRAVGEDIARRPGRDARSTDRIGDDLVAALSQG